MIYRKDRAKGSNASFTQMTGTDSAGGGFFTFNEVP